MRTLHLDDLTFEIRESDRRATLEIIVERDGRLALATPPDVPREDLEAFVTENLVWIYTKLEAKAQQARPHRRKTYVTGEGFPYLGRHYRLRLVEPEAQRVALRLTQGRFCLRRDAVPDARGHFIDWYTVHLRPVLDRHLAALTDRVGARPNRIHVRDLGYRWGSTDRHGHLYIHWRVAMLPQRMIRYIVAHELVHLRERAHTAEFWARLRRIVPEYEELRQWLADEGGTYDL